MTQDEFEDVVHDILLEYQPGDYSLSDVGEDRLYQLSNSLFNKKEDIIMSNATPKVFEVTAIESFDTDKETDTTKDPIVHMLRKDRIGTDAESLKFEIQHELASSLKGKDVSAFFNRLEVKVEAVNFQG